MMDSEENTIDFDRPGFLDLSMFAVEPAEIEEQSIEVEPQIAIEPLTSPESLASQPLSSLHYNKYTPYYLWLSTKNQTFKLGAFLPNDLLDKLPLNNHQIAAFADQLDWDVLSELEIAGPLMVKYKDKINWDIFLRNGKPKEINYLINVRDKLIEHQSVFFSHRIKKRYYNTPFVLIFDNMIDWKWLIKNKKLEDYVLLKYWHKFKPNDISRYQTITYEVAKEKLGHINWGIAGKHKLSESTIELASDYLNWQVVCRRQKRLSESFLTRFANRLHWLNTSIYQTLTPAFIRKFIKKLNIPAISEYQNMPIDLIRELEDRLDFSKLVKNKHYNKSGSIQITTNGIAYFIIEPPIIGKVPRINYITNIEGDL